MKFKKPKFWDDKKISIWSILLFPISLLYLILSIIDKIYKTLIFRKNFKIPVICIGNIYIGGTGKTPLVSEIYRLVQSMGKNPSIIKKNYEYLSDEINMLKKVGAIFVDKNRTKAIKNAILKKHDIAILDDGFQDFSIKPTFSILCFNSKQLIGNGFLIPSGPLREYMKSILRADCIFINGDKNLEFENKIKKYLEKKNIQIFYTKYKIKNLEKLQNKEITAFAGIGNPSNFFDLLKENGLNLKESFSFPDHHTYSKEDFDRIKKNNSTKIVTTEKDYCRMSNEQKAYCEGVEVSLEIENKEDFKSLIKNYI
tara:strand:+ start:328 stop:1263 length:936 start_codon:yes stop_codon:yes gene_type:complete